MKIRNLGQALLAACLLVSGSALAQAVSFGDGGAALDEIFDAAFISPDDSTLVATQVPLSNDGYWSLGPSGGTITYVTALEAPPAGLEFGLFDETNPNVKVAINPPQVVVQLKTSVGETGFSVVINFQDTGVNFASNSFGLYVTDGTSTWYSDTSLNSDGTDHMVAYGPGDNSSIIDVDGPAPSSNSAGPWLANEYFVAWEAGTDFDYADLVLIVQSISPMGAPRAALGDFVWNDANNNGIQDVGEAGIGNVLVQLLDCSGNVLSSTETAADGSYLFGGLLPGGYKVKFFAPPGYGFTVANQGSDESADSDAEIVSGQMGTTECITLADEDNLDVDAGLVQKASLGNFVWEDLNGNGLQDDGEPGVPGVLVTLDSGCDSTGDASVPTDANGFYKFTDLVPGEYCVVFQLPGGYQFTTQNQGANDAIDSDADTLTGRTASTTLDPGENDLTWDAGIVRPASLGDFVWNDLNRDGVQDVGEPGIKDVLVELFDCDGNPVSDIFGNPVVAVKTDDNGNYAFGNLRPGGYTVKFTARDGFEFTTAVVGPDDKDSDAETLSADGTMATTRCIELASGENNPDVDAGLRAIAESSLGDFVWEDSNANGIQDADELLKGIADVSVELLTCDDAGATTSTGIKVTTDANGYYLFEGLTKGNYAVRFELDPLVSDGYFVSPSNEGANDDVDSDADPTNGYATACVFLDTESQNLSLDAGVFRPASLGDFVWLDTDGDGIQDLDEVGVVGARVELFDCSGDPVVDVSGNLVGFTTTDANGKYGFENLVPGGYTVKFTAPDGYEFTTANAGGSTEANDSDAELFSGNMGTTDCVTLVSGQNNPDVDAGLELVVVAECLLDVNATCSIVQRPASDFVCKDAKPIDTLQMIWNGQDDVKVVAHYGTVSKAILETVEDVDNGELVSISGFAGSTNDVEWEIFDAGGNLLGISRFHLSCSDSNMNGPEDCGLPAGDGKDDGSSLVNDWLLEGMIGANGNAFQCTPPAPGPGEESCTFTTPAGPHCQGKVTAMSLRYLGGNCTFSNTQDGKAECLVDGSAGEPARIVVSDGGSKVYLDVDGVEIGNVVTASAATAGEDDFGSNTVVEIFSETGSLVQSFEMHTSCSKPLNLGDQFASVEVVGLNTTEGGDASLGAEVVFDYQIVNNSIERFIDDASDNWGVLGTLTLEAEGGSASFSRTRFILPGDSNVYTNTLTVSGSLEFSGLTCEAEDDVPVTRVEPPAPQLACSEIKPITQLSMVWNGGNGVDVLTAGGQFFSNLQNGNLITFDVAGLGNDVELTLSGAVTGMSAFHVSCSDDNMDGPEDCPIPQGNNKGDEAGLINDWKLEAMIGETGSFVCGQENIGEVLPEADPGTGGGAIALLFSEVDGNRIKMEMENLTGSDRYIESVDFVWPEGTLKKMKFNGDFVKDIEKTTYGTAGSIMVPEDKAFEDDPNKRKIKKDEKRKLEIEFDEDLEKLGLTLGSFTVVVTFDDGTMVSL